jgi:hypothetical protein
MGNRITAANGDRGHRPDLGFERKRDATPIDGGADDGGLLFGYCGGFAVPEHGPPLGDTQAQPESLL